MKTTSIKLDAGKYLTDLLIDISEKYLMIVSPTGSGKTEWAVNTITDFDMLYPTKMNGEQKSSKYKIHFVKEGIDPNNDNKQFGTFDSIRKFTKRDCSNRTLIIDESHHHILSASENFRRDTIHALIDAFDVYKQVILLTGTPIETTHSLINKFKVYNITHKVFENYTYKTVSYKSEIASLQQHFVKNSINFIFCNDKKRINFLSEFFNYKGYKTGIVTSDTFGDSLSLSLINTSKIDESYDIIFATSVISECVDIMNHKLGSIQFLTKEDPSTIKQFISRFRKKKPHSIYLYNKFDNNSSTFSIKEYENILKNKANNKVSLLNLLLDEEMIQKELIVNAVREDMKSEFIHMFRIKDEKYIVDETGIAFLVRTKYLHAIYSNKKLFTKALSIYEMNYICHENNKANVSKEDKDYLDTLKSNQQKKNKELFEEELNTYESIGKDKTEVFRNKSENASRLLDLTEEYNILFSESISLIREYGTTTQKYNSLIKKMNILRYKKEKGVDCEGTIDTILKSFIVSKKYTGDEIFNSLYNILYKSDFYNSQLSEAKSIRMLKNFFEIKRCKIKNSLGKYSINGYIIISNNPLCKYLPNYLTS